MHLGFRLHLLSALIVCMLAPALAHAQVRSRLQWFDSHGEVIDLDWATSVQWIWSQEKTPVAQVIISVPEQINLSSSDETQAKFMNGVPDREGKVSNRTLVVEMEGPRKTVKLQKLDPSSDIKEIGLTVLLSTDTPNIVPSESCAKEGISIEPRQAEANFIFLAASCRKTAAGLRITLETSNDAILGKDEDEKLEAHSAQNPLVIVVPKKTTDIAAPDTVLATVRAESQTTPPITTQFEFINLREAVIKTPAAHLAKAAPIVVPPPVPEKKTWALTAELGLGYLGYQSPHPRNGNDANEYQLDAKFTAEHSLFDSRTHLKTDLEIPVVAIMPDAKFAASGLYRGTARAALTVFDRGKIAFHLEPGVEVAGAYFRDRSAISGFYAGPVLAAYLNGTVSGLNNRGMGLLVSFAPLAGRGIDPFFHSYDLSTEFSTEIVKGDVEKHWDLVLRYRYLNFHETDWKDARASELLFGLRTGL